MSIAVPSHTAGYLARCLRQSYGITARVGKVVGFPGRRPGVPGTGTHVVDAVIPMRKYK